MALKPPLIWISPGSAPLCQRITLKSFCKDTRYDTGASGMQPAINSNYQRIQVASHQGGAEGSARAGGDNALLSPHTQVAGRIYLVRDVLQVWGGEGGAWGVWGVLLLNPHILMALC